MNFRKFVKHMNRGLLLAVLLIVAMTSYIVADAFEFKKSEPEIKQFLNQYYQNIKESVPIGNSNAKEFGDEYNSLINEYWLESESNIYNYYKDKSSVISEADAYINDKSDFGKVENWSYSLSDIKVSKSGPGTANIKYDYSIMVEFTGGVVLIPTASGFYISDENYSGYGAYTDGEENQTIVKNDDESKQDNTKMIYNLSGSDTLKIKKVNGEWKLYGSSNSTMQSSIREAEGDE